MNALQNAEPRKNRFQITRLEDRIAPAALVSVEIDNNHFLNDVRILNNSVNHTLNNLHAQVNVLSVGNVVR